jgi:hypothetical protein
MKKHVLFAPKNDFKNAISSFKIQIKLSNVIGFRFATKNPGRRRL